MTRKKKKFIRVRHLDLNALLCISRVSCNTESFAIEGASIEHELIPILTSDIGVYGEGTVVFIVCLLVRTCCWTAAQTVASCHLSDRATKWLAGAGKTQRQNILKIGFTSHWLHAKNVSI